MIASHLRPALAAVLAGMSIFITGCASSGPIVLDVSPIYGNAKPLPDPAESVSVLPVCVAPLDSDSVGIVYGQKIVAAGLAQALADALVDLSDRDVTFLTSVAANHEEFAASEAPAKLSVVKAYLTSVYDSKSAVVVLRVESELGVEYFRAQNTGLTYIAAAEEMSFALRKALQQALEESRPHLAAIAARQG